MPEYLSPAVYIEEVPGQQPIEGVSTSTTGFVGVTLKGPTAGKPTLVTSYAEFIDIFGGGAPKPASGPAFEQWAFEDHNGGHWWDFALSVRGFFDNGGRRLFIKRVLPATALSSSCAFAPCAIDGPDPAEEGRFALRAAAPPAGGDPPRLTVTFYAKDRGGWSASRAGRPPTLTVRVQPVRSRRILAVKRDGAASLATLSSMLPAGATTVSVDFTGTAVAASSTAVPIRVGGERLMATIAITTPSAATTPGKAALTLSSGPRSSSAMGTRVQFLRAVSTVAGTAVTIEVSALTQDGDELLYNGALVLAGPNDNRFTVSSSGLVGGVPKVTLQHNGTAPIPTIYEGDALTVVEAAVDVAFDRGDVLLTERITGLGFHPDAPLPFAATVKERSKYVEAELSSNTIVPTWAAFPGFIGQPSHRQPLDGGDDKLDDLDPADFVGVDGGPGRRTGIVSFEDIDDINLCAAPGIWAEAVRNELIIHCENMRTRFAVLDPPPGKSVVEIMAFRSSISSKYAALYYPWIRVDTADDGLVDLAPSAHLIGLYGRVDNERGVHKAPANEVVLGISGFADDINQREQDLLNPVGVNALRTFPNRGNRVWGARTLAAESEWRYVNVRRLFLFIEESIRRGTQWVVFEPNAEDLWSRVRQSVTDFLDIVWRSGALEGLTRAEAFYVRCDATTNTPADVAAGRLVIEVGIAPVKPAEFVIFRFHQKTRDQRA